MDLHMLSKQWWSREQSMVAVHLVVEPQWVQALFAISVELSYLGEAVECSRPG